MSSDRDRPRPLAAALVLALAGLLAAGCGSGSRAVFEPLDPPLRWPAPPAPPRIEYVGALRGDRDLKRAPSLGEALFGRAAERTMRSPYGVCTDGGDRLFVVDAGDALVHVFDLVARRYEQWTATTDAKAGSADTGGFARPLGAVWDGGGARLLVADAEAGHVVVLDDSGRRQGVIGAGVLVRPSDVAVDAATGRIFVADVGAHQVVVFEAGGPLVRRLGARGTGPGRFNYPTNLAFGPDGALYVTDTLNFRVQVFDRTLEPLRMIGAHGDAPGYFSQPKGLALDRENHLYVVDAHFESVQIFDDAGRLLLTFGREGGDHGEFWLPAAIHIDEGDRIWIADTYNRRVQVFRYLAETGGARARGKED